MCINFNSVIKHCIQNMLGFDKCCEHLNFKHFLKKLFLCIFDTFKFVLGQFKRNVLNV